MNLIEWEAPIVSPVTCLEVRPSGDELLTCSPDHVCTWRLRDYSRGGGLHSFPAPATCARYAGNGGLVVVGFKVGGGELGLGLQLTEPNSLRKKSKATIFGLVLPATLCCEFGEMRYFIVGIRRHPSIVLGAVLLVLDAVLNRM